MNEVMFQVPTNTPEREQIGVFRIAKLLCNSYRGRCSSISPVQISITSESDEDSQSDNNDLCEDGWIYIFKFKSKEDTSDFAHIISLLEPVCTVTYQSGRFEVCVKPENCF